MSAALDDEDLSISISTSSTRRGSNRPVEVPEARPSHKRPSAQQRSQHGGKDKATQRLGQYSIVKTLGEGSFGKVKLAVHQVSGQHVALKIISRRKLVTRDMAGRIEREIQYLQLLRHPHIIKLYTVITTATEIIMVLEYAGGELFDYIVQNGRMSEGKARNFFQQIVCAVEYCHRHKIVHRDLKPENLLLDENLNVKIADFGLSNIMTDGNFLKTSCGSPNYAAPEVISGKLYAGPEVDVWSCGVILYVLLVGRLPFDDEYIPTLFKKIASGNYHVPNYVPHDAKVLIAKMLEVSPVRRITVQEIRMDPWFNKDLAPYLQLPAEDFLDTGNDPNKAIDPNELTRSKPPAVVQKLHETVVGKLGMTMGYAQSDVHEALSKDEPSAIKDAYLIVRENQIMKENPLLAKEQPSFAQSPPNFDSNMMSSPIAAAIQATAPPKMLTPQDHHARQGSASSSQVANDVRSPVNTIGVLPSSLPGYHLAYMKGGPRDDGPSTQTDTPGQHEQTQAEKDATARSLKPHNRSQVNLDKQKKPDSMTPIPAKKPRATKWQFGIRSRNAPAEAMLAIYKSLRILGADWEYPRIRRPGGSRSRSGSTRSRSRSCSRSRSYSPKSRGSSRDASPGVTRADSPTRGRGRGRGQHGKHDDWGYGVPEDPWVINARFKKSDMFPPGVLHPSSAHSSRVDLSSGAVNRRRSSALATGNNAELGGYEAPSYAGPSSSARNSVAGSSSGEADSGRVSKADGTYPDADESVYVYITIQLYSIEREFYVVDFKCAGYERLEVKVLRELKDEAQSERSKDDGEHSWRVISSTEDIPDQFEFREREVEEGAGRASGEKRATSPFPFLDVASRLIIQLAEGE
ncbi:Pkinase-domain-containing protein [Pseudovirgaria hyperparasitica]|uniref:non-specific serine/threonine protein kinase n=1 Tax=Pseudovirgaria hyperparasitica TaxID=470096 RepID=A0A6A6WJK1_9PEZI|nr:Pkinase-domain-containing protein [Pseudovirgaria hyperparasitica]KAF2762406.1 Pkinase-domain-containing protein [Pseudovirgaria hyperparasitica]